MINLIKRPDVGGNRKSSFSEWQVGSFIESYRQLSLSFSVCLLFSRLNKKIFHQETIWEDRNINLNSHPRRQIHSNSMRETSEHDEVQLTNGYKKVFFKPCFHEPFTLLSSLEGKHRFLKWDLKVLLLTSVEENSCFNCFCFNYSFHFQDFWSFSKHCNVSFSIVSIIQH